MTTTQHLPHEIVQTLGASAPGRPATGEDVATVRRILGAVADPCSIATGVPISLVDMGIVADVRADGDHVHVRFELTSPVCMLVTLIAQQVDEKAAAAGVRVLAEFDPHTEWMPSMMSASAREALRRVRPLPVVSSSHGPETGGGPCEA